jgi:hypothetical protein
VGEPRVELVLSDDWELRGDGSGNMRSIQFATLRRLCDVYEAHGLRGSFNAEVYQQLAHRRLGERHPELARLADEWEQSVREAYDRGHDVQLHLHPQWSDASYRDGRWELRGSWSLLDYPRAALERMLGDAKAYLESVLAPVAPGYTCRAFRAGSWSIAPSDDLLSVLAGLGIVFDMSIAAGVHYDSREVRLDFRDVDEPFHAYYPDMRDARRIADAPQPIVCVPTHTFAPRRANRIARAVLRRWQRSRVPLPGPARERHSAAADVAVREAAHAPDYAHRVPETSGTAPSGVVVADVGQLSAAQLREALDDVRRRAEATTAPVVPVIFGNHTKDLGDFRPVERFARLLAADPDIGVITSGDLADGLRAQRYRVRTADGER